MARATKGDPLVIPAADWNAMMDLVNGGGSGANAFQDSSGTHHRKQPRGGTLTCHIVSVQNDYLTCHIYDEQTETDSFNEIFIAKPWMLRRSPFDGFSITFINGQIITYAYVDQRERTATDVLTSETQVMTPDYYVGEVIDALPKRTIVGLGGISLANGGTMPAGQFATWQDQNTCGRHWAKE